MDQYLESAHQVTTQLFGPDSGIPWWGWFLVVVAVFWKVAVPERKTARQASADRDDVMLSEIFGDGKGRKGKGQKGK